MGVLVPLTALWIVLAVAVPSFFTTGNLRNVLLQSAPIAVMAMGTTICVLTEEIDLSIGATEGLAAVVAASVMVRLDGGWPMAVAAGIGVGAIVGLINGAITTIARIPSFITTLAMLGIATGIALNITGGQSLFSFPTAYQSIGQGSVVGVGVPIIIAVAVLLLLHVMLRKTGFGLHVYAVGSNARAAAMVGIRPGLIKTAALTISGAGAGLAGIIVSARLNSANAEYGTQDLLNAIAAVVIGGTALTGGRGSVTGTALGVLVIISVTNALDLLNVSPFWQQAAIGGIILLVVIWDRRNHSLESGVGG